MRSASSIVILCTAAALCGCAADPSPQPSLEASPQPSLIPLKDESTVVLFDGSSWSHWKQRDGSTSAWIVQPDGSVEINGGDAVSDVAFGDFQLHLEFLCPPMPEAQGQARSNSGVYLHGRYEVQVLDSHGQPIQHDHCGAVYGIAPPLVNASKPAREWQTYDIVFRAPRFNEKDHLTELPRITVIHNGAVIHNNLHLTSCTGGALDAKMPATGPILLQDHGDKVRYRNIWARKL